MEKKAIKPKVPLKGKETKIATNIVIKKEEIINDSTNIVELPPKQTSNNRIMSMASNLFDKYKPKDSPSADAILKSIGDDDLLPIEDNFAPSDNIEIINTTPINNSATKWLEQENDALSLKVSELEDIIIERNGYIQNLEYQLNNQPQQLVYNNQSQLKINGSVDDIIGKIDIIYRELKTENQRFPAGANIHVPYLIKKLEDNFYFLIS